MTGLAGANLQQVCAGGKRLFSAAAAEGRALVGGAGKGDVAKVQDSCHRAKHSFPLSFPNAHNRHSVQRGAQALPVVHVLQRVAGLRAARGLIEIPEACSALLQPAQALFGSCLPCSPPSSCAQLEPFPDLHIGVRLKQ